ncbi:MAG TPA: amino acid adenylation domain-containing protein [Ruminiclostridium sp.]|nr:amino acid adenylation domain-containing protein [Ruminiclostridium sp.]
MNSLEDYRTLGDVLIGNSEIENKGVTFILGNETEKFVSYGGLYRRSLNFLENFRRKGIKPGEELLFQFEDNEVFLYTFWACILGGIIPVPVSVGKNDEHCAKLFKIWSVLKSPYLITYNETLNYLNVFADKSKYSVEFKQIEDRSIIVDNFDETVMASETYISKSSDIAFIQFSSGSTGEPKGVTLTHDNLITNIRAILSASQVRSDEQTLSWMPLTHDMGLIGCHLATTTNKMNQYIMPTSLFIRRPILWFEKVNEHRANILASPNFGYKYFMDSLKSKENCDFDLSCVRIIFNGAEPISYDLCRQFVEEMSVYGLKKDVIFPVYGLAEASLAVTFPPVNETLKCINLDRKLLSVGDSVSETEHGDKNGVTFVDVGYPVNDCNVRICGEEDLEVDNGVVGNVLIKGRNVTAGYYNNTKATSKLITKDGWLKTGDLGLMLNGRLIITGRAKDIIFINGQNYYPHDIERIVYELKEVELGKIVACGAFNKKTHSEGIVLFVLFKKSINEFVPLALKIKEHIGRNIGQEIIDIIPVKKIPKTTSGKVERYKLALKYLDGEFKNETAELEKLIQDEFKGRESAGDHDEIEERLINIWKEVVGTEEINPDISLFELGANSLNAAKIQSRIYKEFGIDIPMTQIFSTPTVRELAAYLNNSNKNKFSPIIPLDKQEAYSVSGAQERMLIMDKIEGVGTAYNVPVAIILEGKLDKVKVDGILNKLINRHEAFRTSFEMINGEFVQKIHENIDFKLDYEDVSANKDSEITADINSENFRLEIDKIISSFIRPFDLSKAPLLRAKLFKLLNQKYVLVMDMHHIITDGTSVSILVKDFISLYKGNSLSDLRVQYKDYTAWQNRYLQTEAAGKQEEYWLGVLPKGVQPLDMPTDYPRSAVQSFEGKTVTANAGSELTDRLKKLANISGTTLYMVLLGAYNILLSKYSGQEDIIVGSPIAARNHPDIEDIVGMFVNTLAMRNYPEAGITFLEFLQSVRTNTLGAYENQDFQFDRFIDKIGMKRDISRNPLFDNTFTLQNMGTPELEIDGLKLTVHRVRWEAAKFDLALEIIEGSKDLCINFDYCTKLYKEETVRKLAGHFINILYSVSSNPDIKLGDIDVLSDDDKKQLLYEFNDTGADYPKTKTIHQIFEEQVEKTPDNIALVFEDRQLTYRQLNESANQLANYLLGEHKLKPDSLVGVLVEKSHYQIIAALGILKAGGAYVPIDPDYPEERIKNYIEDSGVNIVISSCKHKDILDKMQEECRLFNVYVCIDDDGNVLPADSITNAVGAEKAESVKTKIKHNLNDVNKYGKKPSYKVEVTPQNAAYVIYTSGTTGKPKGVVIEHRNVVRLMFNDKMQFDFSSNDVWTMFHSFNFDFSVWEMYGALLYGGKLIVIPKLVAQDTAEFLRLLRREKVTVLNQTPTAFYNLIKEEMKQNDKDLAVRYVIFGGEALKPVMLKEWHDKYPEAKLVNMYGITETTVHVTYKEITEKEINLNKSNIGKPIPTLTTYIMDKNLKLLPIGAIGEICVGGDGVGRGYLNREELTAQKFVQNPYKPGERLYRSGDTARYDRNGDLEYMGRIDHQVKIRGFRLEIGEIENVLLKHKDVKEVVVLAREDKEKSKYLCAFFVADRKLSVSELRQHISKDLPDYMIPSYYVQMEHMPLTPNGKLDRKALPDCIGNVYTGVGYEAPKDEIEEKLVKLWQEMLGLDKVGVKDNFFDLGGNSLLAAKIQSRLKDSYGIEITLVDLFKSPTISLLAEHISNGQNGQTQEGKRLKSSKADRNLKDKYTQIAIIGMSGRFPKSKDIDEFWKNLIEGKECISELSEDEIIASGIDESVVKSPDYVKSEGSLDNIELFDAGFFGFNPREAELTDPQQRIFLETAWEALENSGYIPDKYDGSIGVFAGASMSTYVLFNLPVDNMKLKSMAAYQTLLGNDKDFIPTRVSYKLNLKGPSINVNTACSTSLVATHLACKSLLEGECDMALAGGVSIGVPKNTGYLYYEGGILSPDGHCKPFDSDAKGTVPGNGAGIVVLKRLEDAVRDRDNIYAVIKGSAINNDGSLKVGFTAPSVDGQSEVIAMAQKMAGIDSESITYIETHGTGTQLGDPIEVKALTEAFSAETDKKQFCAIGSVKSNVGHLGAGAGVTGLIKTALSLKNKLLIPSINYEAPNPQIDFENSPFYVNTGLTSWKSEGVPRRAGVSSFGLGGTNAHVVMEEAPEISSSGDSRDWKLMILSAKSQLSLDKGTERLADFLESNEDINLADATYTLQVGRGEFTHRRMVICRNTKEAGEAFRTKDPHKVFNGIIQGSKPVSFMFPGQGAQYVNMGLELYRDESGFRDEVDRCAEILKPLMGIDIRDILYPAQGLEEQAAARMLQTGTTQPVMFVVEYAMAKLWMEWGIMPEAMIGHSLGEYVAACLAGVFTLEEGLRLIVCRGRLMQSLPGGSMLSVMLPLEEVRTLVEDRNLSVATVNGPTLCVVSGTNEDVELLAAELEEKGVGIRRLHTAFLEYSI